MMGRPDYLEIPKGHLFSPDEAARRKLWAEYWFGIFRGVARAHGYGAFIGGSMVRDIDVVIVPWKLPMKETPVEFVLSLVHSMGITMGNHGETLHGHQWFAIWDKEHPDQQIDLKVILPAVAAISGPITHDEDCELRGGPCYCPK